jgi:DNA-binding transcriptional regulator WhiA
MYYRWKQNDIDKLLDKYINENLPVREISSKHFPHLTSKQIVRKLSKLKIHREINPDNWTKEEDSILKERYPTIDNLKDLLEFLPKRTVASINRRVQILHIKRDKKIRYKNTYKNNLKKLLNRSLESFYWIGFIFADGSVEKNGSFGIELSKKDRKHLKKLMLFLGFNNDKIYKRRNNVAFSKCDKNVIDVLIEKYQLKPNKTYDPPDLSKIFKNMTDDQILSLIVGFIDGDGNVRKTSSGYQLTLENHISWIGCYETIKEFIKNKFKITFKSELIRTNNRGYVVMCFSQKEVFLKMREFIYSNNLPILDRKWRV